MSSFRIIIAGVFPFPHGAAASARINNIALGFVRNGWEVYILPSDIEMYMEQAETVNHYSLISPVSKNKKKNKILQFIEFNKDQANLFETTIKEYKINFALLYGDSYYLLDKFIEVSKKTKVKTILDIVEDRKRLINLRSFTDPLLFNTLLGATLLYRRTDFICTISYSLYKKYQKLSDKVILFPGVEDYQDSLDLTAFKNENKVMLYVGALTHRDNPLFLLNFMKLVLSIRQNVTLVIAGKYNSHKKGRTMAKFLKENLGNNVLLTGEITNKALTEWKMKADYFILPRKRNLAEERAFPTRMVEFGKYKKPMILEGVGDILHYFKHMENAFICTEGKIIKEDLFEILMNKNLAESVGLAGFNTCKFNFQCEKVVSSLINKIINEK